MPDILTQLKALKLHGMADCYAELESQGVLRKAAFDWEWLDRVPRVRMLPEPKRRIRWITKDEAGRLIAVLPDHLAAMA